MKWNWWLIYVYLLLKAFPQLIASFQCKFKQTTAIGWNGGILKYQEPEASIYKWLSQLDDEPNL